MTDILAFGVHPDDAELACGGIIAKAVRQGKSVVFVDLTLGDKGTNGTPEGRRQEALAAAALIGAERQFLDFSDCEVIDSYENRLKIVRVIRQYKPKLLLAPLWKGELNHPDHIACGLMVRYACRYARFKMILPELPPHRCDGVLHYLFPSQEGADFIVDITQDLETWKGMMDCHKSQMLTNNYVDWQLRAAARWGMMIGVEYAQALVKGNPVAIEDIMHIAQGTIEI